MRKRHEGSIFYVPSRDRWRAVISLPGGKRITREVRTQAGAERSLAALQIANKQTRTMLMRQSLRPLAREWVVQLLAEARAQSWDDAQTAAVIVAQLAISRVRAGVFGPCVYCGTWVASSVDHVIPKARGGSNKPENLVSACVPCNHAKHNRTPEEWREAS